VVGVNTFRQSPLVVTGSPSSAWKDYNYKSSVQVTGCNPHRSLGRSLEPERERVGDRHEATHKGIRDPPLRDPGLPVEFEASPDSPEILGRGLHGFFKRVGGSGDARSRIDARGWDIQEKQVLHDLLGETPVGPLQFGTKGLGPEVDKKGASYGALQMTLLALRITGFLSGWLVPVPQTFSLHLFFRSSHTALPYSPT